MSWCPLSFEEEWKKHSWLRSSMNTYDFLIIAKKSWHYILLGYTSLPVHCRSSMDRELAGKIVYVERVSKET